MDQSQRIGGTNFKRQEGIGKANNFAKNIFSARNYDGKLGKFCKKNALKNIFSTRDYNGKIGGNFAKIKKEGEMSLPFNMDDICFTL